MAAVVTSDFSQCKSLAESGIRELRDLFVAGVQP